VSWLFLLPAAVLLGAIVVYPLFATAVRSTYDRSGNNFVGLDNYKTLLGTADLLVAVRNNILWVIVAPFLVTFLGLVFAVLTERIRWSTAFKTIMFMPMVFSLFASGLTWRIIYETDPHRGVINAGLAMFASVVNPAGLYTTANPDHGLSPAGDGALDSDPVKPGGTVEMGFNRIPADAVPPGATQAAMPQAAPNGVSGLVWRDFAAGGKGKIGQVDPGELGMPGVRLTLLDSSGAKAATTTTAHDGSFRFSNLSGSGNYHVRVDAGNFKPGFTGIEWLGTTSLTPTSHLGTTGQALLSVPLVVIAEIVIIGAGLAALNREVLEAARIDGATEWQTFRRVTLPMLRPVLIVVLVTMLINVLKIFDIVLAMPPDSSAQASNVIALMMWRIGFTGGGDFGLSSAIAVLLFILVIPAMAFNLKRIRG